MSTLSFERSSDLHGVNREEVWREACDWTAINAELAPLHMSHPPGLPDLEAVPADGRVHMHSTFSVFGLPFDRHAFSLQALVPGEHFHEVSSNRFLRRWVHRRRLESIEGGVRVTDACELEPRLRWLGPVARWCFERVFDQRHARLRARWDRGRA